MTSNEQTLIDTAIKVRENAYAPYSNYFVGAAIIDEAGNLHTGCNVENAAFPQGACAEANAIGAMVSSGGKRISAIAAVGGREKLEACTPCGGCRQRIQEFADEDTVVILLDDRGTPRIYKIAELLPDSFRSSDLLDTHPG